VKETILERVSANFTKIAVKLQQIINSVSDENKRKLGVIKKKIKRRKIK